MWDWKWHPSSLSLRQPVPGREAVHAARPLENIHTGTQIKVIGVGQDDLGPGFVAHVAVKDALDGRRRTYGHKDRGLHHAVIGLQFARSRLRRGVFMLERKFHRCLYNVQKYVKLFIIHKKWSQQCASRSCRGRSVRREGRMVKSRRENATEGGTPLPGRFCRIYPNRQKIFRSISHCKSLNIQK